jgi:hypothetical protein
VVIYSIAAPDGPLIRSSQGSGSPPYSIRLWWYQPGHVPIFMAVVYKRRRRRREVRGRRNHPFNQHTYTPTNKKI